MRRFMATQARERVTDEMRREQEVEDLVERHSNEQAHRLRLPNRRRTYYCAHSITSRIKLHALFENVHGNIICVSNLNCPGVRLFMSAQARSGGSSGEALKHGHLQP